MHRFFLKLQLGNFGSKIGENIRKFTIGTGAEFDRISFPNQVKKKKPRGIGHFQINFNLLK